jgi:predicted transcriptional regulator
MAHLNIYLSRERAKWLRSGLEGIAQKENRSLSYVVEEALVHFIKQKGKHVPKHQRKDHRTLQAR